MPAPPATRDDRWAVPIPEVGRRLGLSRATAYRLVAAGEIPSVRLGRRRVVPLIAIERLLATPDARNPAAPRPEENAGSTSRR